MRHSARSSRPFWLQPKWVVGHVLVVVLVMLFVNFGLWQLDRLDEKRERNAAIAARSSAPVQPVDEVVPAGTAPPEIEELVYRRASARGTWDAGASVLVRSRSLGGRPGFHVLTPLVTGEGTALMVNRGFAPFTQDPEEALAATQPEPGRVEVTGILLASQQREGIGPTDPAEGVLSQIARVDLSRLQQQYGRDLYPMYLQLTDQSPPPADDLPMVLPEPEQDEGNHLSYAVQWFAFAAIGAGGWPLLLRHTARERRHQRSSPPPPPFLVDSPPPTGGDPTRNGRGPAAPAGRPR
ncbi:MAG TPA: SURF1 family protein [Acidimicrobiales bacterium]|nr:SURF1 family protein [Acidimicrobiales bacterium]